VSIRFQADADLEDIEELESIRDRDPLRAGDRRNRETAEVTYRLFLLPTAQKELTHLPRDTYERLRAAIQCLAEERSRSFTLDTAVTSTAERRPARTAEPHTRRARWIVLRRQKGLLPDAAVEPGSLQVLAHRPGSLGVVRAGNPAAKGK
jgi:hypothetical protein